MIDTNKLRKNIISSRKSRGMTQKDLAHCVGVTPQAVSRWERGNACPDITILDEIASALKVSLCDLLGLKQQDVV